MTVIRGLDTNSDLDYPLIQPTLDLNFAATKTLDPRITFTRSSTGTYVGSDGLIKTAVANEPRFEHDAVTGECRGLLIEESRSNTIVPSEDFSFVSGGWATSGMGAVVTANSSIAPDGRSTAYLISSSRIERYDITYSAGTTYTFSVYVKGTKGQTVGIGKLVSGSDGDIILSYFTLDGSWQRFSYTFTSPITASTSRVVISGAGDKSGTATNFYVWGAQLETGSFPTSYIPTSGSTVTRSADLMSITGSNFSSWYNQNEGTVFVELSEFKSGDNSQGPIVGFDGSPSIWDNVQEWGIYYRDSINNFQSVVAVESGTQEGEFTSGITPNNSARLSIKFNSSQIVLAKNGTLTIKNRTASSSRPFINKLIWSIGTNPRQRGVYKRFVYWNKNFTNDQLKLLTQE